ncbi:MAG: hypothetical protein ACM3JH_10845 [Acidithiobacillales bacterium]
MKKGTKERYARVPDLEKDFAKEAAWADARYGPNVARLTKPGRPKKGTKIKATQPHSIRVPDRVWRSLQKKARSRGLSTNAALQLAAMEWVAREQ